MAITAAITVSSATATAPSGSVTATCTVTNSGSTSVNVTGIQPVVTPTGATPQSVSTSVGAVPLGPGQTVAVAGSSGTLAKNFGVTFFSPQPGGPTPGNPSSQVFDVGAVVYTSDGSVTYASTTTVTVSAPSHSNT